MACSTTSLQAGTKEVLSPTDSRKFSTVASAKLGTHLLHQLGQGGLQHHGNTTEDRIIVNAREKYAAEAGAVEHSAGRYIHPSKIETSTDHRILFVLLCFAFFQFLLFVISLFVFFDLLFHMNRVLQLVFFLLCLSSILYQISYLPSRSYTAPCT